MLLWVVLDMLSSNATKSSSSNVTMSSSRYSYYIVMLLRVFLDMFSSSVTIYE